MAHPTKEQLGVLGFRLQTRAMDTITDLCPTSANGMISACPGPFEGQVLVKHATKNHGVSIFAHRTPLACLALSPNGNLLATASTQGTLIHIYSTVDGVLLQEFRRGSAKAEIHSMAFSPNAQWLAVSSSRGTVHIFSLKKMGKATARNSFSQYELPKGMPSSVVTFGDSENKVVVAATGGSNFLECYFDTVRGGEMVLTPIKLQ